MTHRPRFYVLEGQTPVPIHDTLDFLLFGEWLEAHSTQLAETRVRRSRISTIFLGLDHAFGLGPPILFETMVFGGPLGGAQARYTSWHDAMAGHDAMVARVRRPMTNRRRP